MRYRALSPTGDYVFGRGPGAILTDSPQAVGQAAYTRLRLQLGEVFWSVDSGVPYETSIVGYGDKRDRDAVILATLLGTPGVTEVISFDSQIDISTRRYGFSATLQTLYGTAAVTSATPVPSGPTPAPPMDPQYVQALALFPTPGDAYLALQALENFVNG